MVYNSAHFREPEEESDFEVGKKAGTADEKDEGEDEE